MSPDQAERIQHRRKIIRKLMAVVLDTKDEAQRNHARWIIEEKKAEIDQILADGEPPHPDDPGQPQR